ncbi:MAG: chemotaxis protein CheC [Cyclobacteriaceae bacterium]|nr:chemotaxis protein CheC [Cyclobacteriaceae bacterium]
MLSELQTDAVREIVNIGVGRGTSMLAEMTNIGVALTVPEILIMPYNQLNYKILELEGNVHVVTLPFIGTYKGLGQLIMNHTHGQLIAGYLSGLEVDVAENMEMLDGVLSEVSNVLLNGVIGSVSNIMGVEVKYQILNTYKGSVEGLFSSIEPEKTNDLVMVCKASFGLIIEQKISANILLSFNEDTFGLLKEGIDRLLQLNNFD